MRKCIKKYVNIHNFFREREGNAMIACKQSHQRKFKIIAASLSWKIIIKASSWLTRGWILIAHCSLFKALLKTDRGEKQETSAWWSYLLSGSSKLQIFCRAAIKSSNASLISLHSSPLARWRSGCWVSSCGARIDSCSRTLKLARGQSEGLNQGCLSDMLSSLHQLDLLHKQEKKTVLAARSYRSMHQVFKP